MNRHIAVHELDILLDTKRQLLLEGRSSDYQDDNRVAQLRKFLDEVLDESTLITTEGV